MAKAGGEVYMVMLEDGIVSRRGIGCDDEVTWLGNLGDFGRSAVAHILSFTSQDIFAP